MKKIVMAIMVASSAYLANAAAIDWAASAVLDPVATAAAGKNTGANGWLGYVVMGADVASITADLDNGVTTSLLASYVGEAKTSTSKGAFASTGATGNVAAGVQDFYLIVLNSTDVSTATSYYLSNKVTETIDASLDTNIAFGSQAAGTKDASSWKSVGGSVPEPTTGLLVLLGMAGLALKRKVA